MALPDPYTRYRRTQVETANRGELILMVYDGAINSLKHAKARIDEGDMEGKCQFIFKAQDAITELMCSLNFEAGEIARSLYNLYDYMNRRLTDANIKGEPEPVREVIDLLSGLRESWQEAITNSQ